MKALFKAVAAPGFELVERPMPVPGPDEVLIRVLRTGICGTDLHIQRWDEWAASSVTAPLIPGHEFFGEIVEVGSLVHDVAVGDLVSGEGHIVCGMCRNCRAGRRQMCIRTQGLGLQRDGAFAEYLTLPGANVWVHHGGIDPDVGAVFDPLGNAVHTALAFPVVGEDVLVTGCGPIGLMAIAIARHVGARYVVGTDVSADRLEMATRMGADLAVNVASDPIRSAQDALGMREGFDVGFEMSGAPSALPQMIENMNHGGRIAMLGLPSGPFAIDWGKVVTHMLTVKGIYGREMFETWNAMGAMLQSSAVLRDRIASVISERLPASQWERAFELAGSGGTGKIILDWTRL
jgi:threonine 3-dehydrogenase